MGTFYFGEVPGSTDDPEGQRNMENFMRSIMDQVMQQMMGGEEPEILISSGYIYDKDVAYVALSSNRPQMILAPQQAVDVAWSLLKAAYRAESDGVWFDILRTKMADSLGNVRGFSSEDAEIVGKLVKDRYAQLDAEEIGEEEETAEQEMDDPEDYGDGG